MSPILIAGTIIVNLALISYSIAIVTEQVTHRVTGRVRLFLALGVVLDITATVCMIAGSTHSPFTLHGILGYSSLSAMSLDALLAWRHWGRRGEEVVSKALHLYSRLAFAWWVAAFVTGATLVLLAQ
jgi:hypothetical protein